MVTPLRYLDVETTGLHADAELLEIAILDEHGETLLDTLVRPTHEHAWAEAQEIHGITPRDVAAAPTLDELTERIATALRDAEVVAYNASFDADFVPASARTWKRMHCAMQAFTAEFGEWDDYFGDRRLVALDDAAAIVRCKIHDAHRALCDARRCRAVWRYLNEPAERMRVDAANKERAARREARWYLDIEEQQREATRERDARRRSDAWMRWLRFPLWMSPAAHGHSPLERRDVCDAYVDDVTRLVTGYSRDVHELRLKHGRLPVYRRRTDIPAELAPLSQLRLPRWAGECVCPRACYVAASGRRFVLLYRLNALEEAYQKHPLRRPVDFPPHHALYTRTELRKAGFTKSEIEQLVPAVEAQNTRDWKWYPLFCMPEREVVGRREARAGAARHNPPAAPVQSSLRMK